jgi:hypothetical protein
VGENAVGKVAKVVSRIRGTAGPGEVTVLVSGTYETYLAYCDTVLERGTEALLISSHSSGSFNVVPWPDTTTALLPELQLPDLTDSQPTPGPDANGVPGTIER